MSAHAGPAAQQQPSSDEKAVAPTLHALDEQVAAAAITPLEQGAHQNRFGLLSIIGLSYAILNSPTAMSASLSVVLTSGGPVSVIWGVVVSATGVLAIAASLAECCAVAPTSGGPYHWAFMLSGRSYQKATAFITGWIAVAGWVCLTATTSSLAGTLIVGAIALMHPDYEEKAWHVFLIYVGFAILGWLVNVFGAKLLDPINRAALFWSLAGVAVIMITTLACASPSFQSGDFVFRQFVNSTGWPDGVAWILGLLQSTFGLVGVDGVTHMVHELPNPSLNAPRAMILAPIIGAGSAIILLITFLFVLSDFEQVTTGSAGPLLTILYQATNNRAGAICLYVFPVASMAFAAIAILCASSRQTQAFARDRGIIFSSFFASENERLGVPVPAITFSSIWVCIFGLVFLGSSTALNSILSASVVLLQVSYCIPVILLLIRGRRLLDELAEGEPRTFDLGRWGYAVNAYGVAFMLLTTVFFFFPSELPVSGSNMNYVVVVCAVVTLIAVISYLVDGRRNYVGPLDIGHQLALARARASAPGAGRKEGSTEGTAA